MYPKDIETSLCPQGRGFDPRDRCRLTFSRMWKPLRLPGARIPAPAKTWKLFELPGWHCGPAEHMNPTGHTQEYRLEHESLSRLTSFKARFSRLTKTTPSTSRSSEGSCWLETGQHPETHKFSLQSALLLRGGQTKHKATGRREKRSDFLFILFGSVCKILS